MLPKPALLSSIEVPEPALSLSSAGLALLRVLAVSMYFSGTIPDNGTTQPALYRPPHCNVHKTMSLPAAVLWNMLWVAVKLKTYRSRWRIH